MLSAYWIRVLVFRILVLCNRFVGCRFGCEIVTCFFFIIRRPVHPLIFIWNSFSLSKQVVVSSFKLSMIGYRVYLVWLIQWVSNHAFILPWEVLIQSSLLLILDGLDMQLKIRFLINLWTSFCGISLWRSLLLSYLRVITVGPFSLLILVLKGVWLWLEWCFLIMILIIEMRLGIWGCNWLTDQICVRYLCLNKFLDQFRISAEILAFLLLNEQIQVLLLAGVKRAV